MVPRPNTRLTGPKVYCTHWLLQVSLATSLAACQTYRGIRTLHAFAWHTSVVSLAHLHCIDVHQPICYHCQRCHLAPFRDCRELPYTSDLYWQHSLVSRMLLAYAVSSLAAKGCFLSAEVFACWSANAAVQMFTHVKML